MEISDEFVKVQCFLNSATTTNDSIYTDFYAFIPSKNNTKRTVYNPLVKDSVSVLIIGVDTVSRLNFHRQMPLTLKFLVQNLSAVELLGYNKVDDNTFLNLVPVLTGLSKNELEKSCWPSRNSIFDDCSYVWDTFRAAGYTTAFAEDAPWMGMFHYLKRGFRKQPTDYYARPFNYQAEESIGFEKRKSSKLCVGPRKGLEVLLNYAFKFSTSMKNFLSFSLIWGSGLGHDYLNLPKQGDKDHKNLLERLHNEEIFDRTILVFMSDHGMRWGGIRKTFQGYLEERLPFLFLVYPKWFRQKFTTAVSNLKRNAKKLTSPFDLHETLLDLVDLTRLEKDVLRTRSEELGKTPELPRGISLFLPIPESRACKDAGIVDHWCTCHQSVTVPTDDSQVKVAADFLIDHINSLVKEYPRCARLQLHSITNARQEKSISHKTFNTSDVGLTDYSLTVETIPGKALFESTVRFNGNTNISTIVGSVSRINLYGDQSSCISDYRLRLYCYCT